MTSTLKKIVTAGKTRGGYPVLQSVYPVAALLLCGCLCSGQPTDEERLKKRIDTTATHLYVGARVGIADASGDKDSATARQKIIELLQTLQTAAEKGEGKEGLSLSPGEVVSMGKQLYGLKKVGATIVRGESSEKSPVLPVLLKALEADFPFAQQIDLPTDHALFFLVLSVLTIHESIPVPPEFLLYEAWQTVPEDTLLKGFALPLHAMKAGAYGKNDFCDLAQKEAETAERTPLVSAELMADFTRLGIPGGLVLGLDGTSFEAGSRALAFAGVSLCHLARGNDKEARPAMQKFVNYGKQSHLLPDEAVAPLEVYYLCGGEGDEVSKGRKKLDGLTSTGKIDEDTGKLLGAWCEAAEKTDSEKLRKLLLAAYSARIAYAMVNADRLEQTASDMPVARTIGGLAQILDAATNVSGNLSGQIDQWKSKIRATDTSK